MKKQVIYIGWWVPKENFKDYRHFLDKIEYNPYEEKIKNWNKTLWDYLGEDYEYIIAPLRNRDYAYYLEWKIMFEKLLPYLNKEIIIVAASLGGSFIMKYIDENDGILDPKSGKKVHISKLIMLAPAIEDTPDEILGSFSVDIETVAPRLRRWCQQIYVYQSHDDEIVPFEQALKIKNTIPEVALREFYDRGHWYLETRIPELEADIKS